MKKLSLFTLFCFIMSIFACKKDNLKPVVSIATPTTSQSVKSNTVLNMTGTVSDDSGLHEMSISIVQASDGKELFKISPNILNKKTYSFGETWTPTVAADTKVVLTVKAMDHSDLLDSKSVEFTITK